jgi:aryl-alcohol dehydrogenase-like predicted oxidoreductase
MEKRSLGKSGLKVAPLAFGGNVFGWTVDQLGASALLDRFIDAGFNLIDTADVYSNWVKGNRGGESEIIIGKWMKDRKNRNEVVLATKVGSSMERSNRKNLSKDYILGEVEESLRRLQTDYIDLYQSHYDDPETNPDETLEALSQLVKQGKVRVIGASNFSAERLKESLKSSNEHGYARYESFQPQYNLYDREPFESTTLPVCIENEIGVIPYYGLASGFLTGKYRSEADLAKSVRGGGVKKYLNDRGFRILKALDEVSKKHNATPANISLAWLMSRPGITAPIASATSVQQLEELMKATVIRLNKEDIQILNDASK